MDNNSYYFTPDPDQDAYMYNLLSSGIVNMEDTRLRYISPNHEYHFITSRSYNELWTTDMESNEDIGQYVIDLIVENSYHINILHTRFNEIVAIRIIDIITSFLEDEYKNHKYQQSIMINLNSIDTSLSYLKLELYCDNHIYGYDNRNNVRDIVFKFHSYDYTSQQMKQLLVIYLSEKELKDLNYIVFFGQLIDLELRQDENYIDNILYRMMDRIEKPGR